MKIEKTYPPNYAEICAVIPAVQEKEGIVFTYGDTIYNPSDAVIEDHLDLHESIHCKQQEKMGIENWWKEFLADPVFRLEQETEAYQAQYQFVFKTYGRGSASMLLKQIADDMSGSMYGNILTRKEARKLIIKK